MAFDTAIDAPGNGDLVKRAVQQSRTLSIDGMLERVFALAFSGLVYPQIWEDPVVDLAAMEIEPNHHIVTIASGGCNVLSYLTASPAQITAVDLNAAHVALTRLKLAGLKKLPTWADFYRFFGEADDRQNAMNYAQYLRPEIDSETRKYWDGRNWTGGKRFKNFQTNIYRKGLLGHFIGISHLVAKLYGRDLKSLLQCRSMEQQRQFFETQIAPLLEKPLIKWITDRKVSLYGLGIPPAQYEALAGGRRMSDVLHERLERLVCSFPLRQNYFTWQAFGRSYAPGAAGPVPPYLYESNFIKLRGYASRATVHQITMTDALNAMPAQSADRFVLLDAQDWMNDTQLNDLWQAITQAATPNARVIFRTAGNETILPGRIDAAVLDKWQYLEERSQELGKLDRSSIYGGFHIYELSK